MRRLALLLVSLSVLLGLVLAPGAFADGDPGSDVLLDQNLFYGSDFPISIAGQLQLGRLLDATAAAGAPVRVAIVAHRDDLGALTSLWLKPQQYAAYLGFELSDAYPGRLLIVMPDGFGFYWRNHPLARVQAALSEIRAPSADGADGVAAVTAATVSAVTTLEELAGVSRAELAADIEHARASSPAASTTQGSAGSAGPTNAAGARTATTGREFSVEAVALVLIVALTSVLWAPAAWRRRGRVRLPAPHRIGSRRLAGLGAAAGLGVAAIIALEVAIPHLAAGPSVAGTLATNPNLDPGTTLPGRPAPGFTLTDESGHEVNLGHYRGKVVILSFVDAECQTICPLTTAAMLDAKRELGPAGRDVQLLGVDANWRSIQIDDVLNYTDLHGLAGQWHFLTGSLRQLERVWTAYKLNEYSLLTDEQRADTREIDHVAATYVIDPQGRLRMVYQTQSSYAAIPQLGQLLAQEAARLLPSHPRVDARYSYAEVAGTPPSSTVPLPRVGGGTVTLGPGHPHMYVFFATWDRQTAPLAADLEQLNRYARTASRDGLPTPVAVDEASVEPSRTQLASFLKTLPGPLGYPVALDRTGRIADGYTVEGEPWFVLTNAAGHKLWYQEVYTAGWPSNRDLITAARAALRGGAGTAPGAAAAERELAGSPPSLAALHAQASKILPGGQQALDARIKALRGYPIVVNIWGSWCQPCQDESHLLAAASAQYGKRVAFIGADTNDEAAAGQQFLGQHHVSYPSYETTPESLQAILPAGLDGTPTTIFISPAGKTTYVNIGPYESQGSLDQAIQSNALGG